MRNLLFFLCLSLCGCATFSDKALDSSKCLIKCAIRCSAESALEVGRCDISRDKVNVETVMAAQCMAKCAANCGINAID